MEYIEKSDNVERVYYVYYDEKKLKELLDKIVRNVSCKTNGKFTTPGASYEGKKFVSGADLPNGDPMFENIESIYPYTSEGQYGYHGDSTGVQGTKVTSPKLAFIIENILSNNPESIYEFLKYETNDELVPIAEKIEAAYKAVDEIDNSVTYIVIANNCIKTNEIKTNSTELVNYGLFTKVELDYLINNNIMNSAINKLVYYNIINNRNKKIYIMKRRNINL